MFKNEYLVISDNTPKCPLCKAQLKYRDRRRRIMKLAGGKVCHLYIRRLICSSCRKLHNELPDCLSPYIHFSTHTLISILRKTLQLESLFPEESPSESTTNRWLERFYNKKQTLFYLKKRFFENDPIWLPKALSLIHNLQYFHLSIPI